MNGAIHITQQPEAVAGASAARSSRSALMIGYGVILILAAVGMFTGTRSSFVTREMSM